jgi:DNA-binding NtrC family response regulator
MTMPNRQTRRPPVLIIEDTISLRLVYRAVAMAAGHSVVVAGSAAEGLAQFHASAPSIVLLDVVLPDGDGLALMSAILAERPETRVIVLTAHGSVNRAIDAMRAGAQDFLVKPVDEARLTAALSNAAIVATMPAKAAPAPTGKQANLFVGSSEAMQRIHTKIDAVAKSLATVFVTGESGTGKELTALAVHAASPRASGPFIALNCGAIPQDLLESEVFGHMKGSFTGAISDKPGAAQAADGGTLFLDEICEMAPALQTKLLRFLQTSTIVPVGATKPRKVNVRIVCATNRDPMDAVRMGHFREDLFYRLFVVPIHMPPLRERGDDVIEIAETALARFAQEEGRQFEGLSPDVRALFRRLTWPGNVRQLLNVIRNVVVLHDGGVVSLDMLPAALPFQLDDSAVPAIPDQPISPQAALQALLGRPLAEVERLLIEATLAQHAGSVPKAARVLDVSPSTLYRKIESWSKR